MPKASLTFDLPEEQNDFKIANHSIDMWIILSDFDNELRSHLRHNSHPEWDEATVMEIRKILLDMRTERGIYFD